MNKIKTQGIKYTGSKLKLLPHILSLAKQLNVSSILDGFSGTTRVSQAFAQNGFCVTSNDIAEYSYIFGQCYLLNKELPTKYAELIEHLEHLQGYDGWFTQYYGGIDHQGSAIQADGTKKPWQIHNTRKLDAIREEIDRLTLTPIERAVALTSLILALDEVDNTLGHFTSYLKNWSARSYKTMKLKVPELFINQQQNHVYQNDIFQTISDKQFDLAYFDPPYGSNNQKMPSSRVRYASYYHLWETICKNDHPPLFGVANRRQDSSDKTNKNIFEDFHQDTDGNYIAAKAIDCLVEKTQAHYIALSYSSGGKATAQELDQILHKHGKLIQTIEISYEKNIMSKMKWTNEWLREAETPNKEFIFLIEK
ncbi:DNA adenine methylase [Neisseria sp. Ec49-e6-T10]|uniref:DNA adenine methylase n=1 Tax=Neisseria sp. Ec49-e6-T10 TaxID=3140744 RepID=UPI003EB8CA69